MQGLRPDEFTFASVLAATGANSAWQTALALRRDAKRSRGANGSGTTCGHMWAEDTLSTQHAASSTTRTKEMVLDSVRADAVIGGSLLLATGLFKNSQRSELPATIHSVWLPS